MAIEEDLIIEGRQEAAEDRIGRINAQRILAGCHPDELLCIACGQQDCFGHEDNLEPWQVSLQEYRRHFFIGVPDPEWAIRSQSEHLEIIRRALQQGKPVPPEVIRDYEGAGYQILRKKSVQGESQ